MTTKTERRAKGSRCDEIATMLQSRRRDLLDDVQDQIRRALTDGTRDGDVLDRGEISEVGVREEIGFALMRMKSETVKQIDAALRRLEEGTYGRCFVCGDEIRETRLRALPFAVRCTDCESDRETIERHERLLERRRDSSALHVDLSH